MDDAFKIFVEQLRDGHIEELNETLSPDFLDVHEKELAFPLPIKLKGQAYLAEDNLILKFNVSFDVQLPCVICNQSVICSKSIEGSYHSIPLDEVKTGVYNFRELLREVILLDVPRFAECNEGACPERKEIAKYLKESSSDETEEDEGYQPFADLTKE